MLFLLFCRNLTIWRKWINFVEKCRKVLLDQVEDTKKRKEKTEAQWLNAVLDPLQPRLLLLKETCAGLMILVQHFPRTLLLSSSLPFSFPLFWGGPKHTQNKYPAPFSSLSIPLRWPRGLHVITPTFPQPLIHFFFAQLGRLKTGPFHLPPSLQGSHGVPHS